MRAVFRSASRCSEISSGCSVIASEAGPVHRAAVKQEPHAARPARAGLAEVHAGQAAGLDLKPAFLAHLPLAGLPWRLPVGLHDAAGNRPSRLVRRLEDQQPPGAVVDQCSGRRGDGREDFEFTVREFRSAGHGTKPTDPAGQILSVGSSGADRLSTAPATAGEALIFASSARSRTARCDSVSSPVRSTSPITETMRGPTISSRR